jgi:hypothetical protein
MQPMAAFMHTIGRRADTENLLESLLLDILAVQHLFKLLESSFYCWAVSWIWMPHYTIIIQFLCDVMHHILGWR